MGAQKTLAYLTTRVNRYDPTCKSIDKVAQRLYSQQTCLLCDKKTKNSKGELFDYVYVDHYQFDENEQGPVRALLCSSCNTMEGKVKKEIDNGVGYDQLCKKFCTTFVEKVCNVLYPIGDIQQNTPMVICQTSTP